jgi:hypothetical protein
MNRPTHKELSGKIRQARDFVASGHVAVLNDIACACDALDLGYDIESELQDVLRELLTETGPEQYGGSRPPMRSYEEEIAGLDLFPFVIQSRRFGCAVYLKFALAEDVFWLVSLHKDREQERK